MTLLPMPGLLLQADHDRVSQIIRNEYFGPDVVKFRELAHAPVPARSLWQATGGEPDRSVRYRVIYADLGYGDDLRVVFRSGSGVWGSACLARAAADPPFSQDEISFLARVSEPVAHGLRLSHLLASGQPTGSQPPGVLIVADDDSIVSITGAARHWLAQLPADQARGLDLPIPILGAARRGTCAGRRPARRAPARRAHPHVGRALAAAARCPADPGQPTWGRPDRCHPGAGPPRRSVFAPHRPARPDQPGTPDHQAAPARPADGGHRADAVHLPGIPSAIT